MSSRNGSTLFHDRVLYQVVRVAAKAPVVAVPAYLRAPGASDSDVENRCDSENCPGMSFTIHLRRGVFQGDSLLPLLFCLWAAPLSHRLRRQAGFESEHSSNAPEVR